jgi:hypothetical protein
MLNARRGETRRGGESASMLNARRGETRRGGLS